MDLEMLGAASAAPATLTEALQDRLRQDIFLGALRPGAKLKLEMLSKSYDVSVNTMREALSRMAAEGLVLVEAQQGFTVLPVSLEDLRQITEMRQLLECHALRQSIARADSDWEAKVVGAYHKLSKVEALVETDPEQCGDSWERYNQEFHAALIANCQSRWLILFHKAPTVSAIACCPRRPSSFRAPSPRKSTAGSWTPLSRAMPTRPLRCWRDIF